jgi:Sec-independent protein translocase protein TatA
MPTLPEVALILFIMMVVFGRSSLPRLGDALGHAVGRLFGRKAPPQDQPPRS